MTFKQTILNKLDDNKSISDKVAKAAGYSCASSFRRVLNNESKEFDKFYGLIKAVRMLFPDNELELMSEYALTLDPKKKSACYMLEYLEISKLQDTKRILIDRMKNCSNVISKEWASIYEVDDQYCTGEITFMTAIEKYGRLKCSKDETKVATTIFKSYCYLDQQMHNLLSQTIFSLDVDIISIHDDYIREMYYSRLMILQIANSVSLDKIEEARHICKKVLDRVEDPNYRAWAYMHLGNTYMIDSYSTSIDYLKKGLAIAPSDRYSVKVNLKRSINFLSNLWNKEPEFLNHFSSHASDKQEIAFYHIQKNEKLMALSILNKLEISDLNDSQRAFNMYFRGLIDGKVKNFSDSIIYFKKSGEFFFRKLPLLELEKMGIDQSLLVALAV
jgi:tetratricopeptide (TPR) repeat protein